MRLRRMGDGVIRQHFGQRHAGAAANNGDLCVFLAGGRSAAAGPGRSSGRAPGPVPEASTGGLR